MTVRIGDVTAYEPDIRSIVAAKSFRRPRSRSRNPIIVVDPLGIALAMSEIYSA
jgi:hypothetical protein